MAKYWMHNGLMQASSEVGKLGGRNTRPVEGDLAAQEAGKISKSKGSAPFRDMLKKFSGEVIRFFILSTQYRRPIDYSEERLAEVRTGMDTFYRFFSRYHRVTGSSFYDMEAPHRYDEKWDWNEQPNGDPFLKDVLACCVNFKNCMDDDFNTGGAIGALFDLVRALNKFVDDNKLEDEAKCDPAVLEQFRIATTRLREYTTTLGLFRKPPQEKVTGGSDEVTDKLTKMVKMLIDLRAQARGRKDFATADHIRQTLSELGILLEDRPGGTEWSMK